MNGWKDTGALPLDFGDPKGPVQRSLDSVDWDFRNHLPLPAVKRIHGLHWYPAPFPAALVGTLLDILAPVPGRYVDPFCGTAVGPVEAWLRGFEAVGIDVNRFAIDVAVAKTNVLLYADQSTGDALVASYDSYRSSQLVSWENLSPEVVCKRAEIQDEAVTWFSPNVLVEIAVAKHWVRDAVPDKWRAVVRVLLSSSLHRASELRDVHYTYVVDRSRVASPARGHVDFPKSMRRKIHEVYRDAEVFREEMSTSGKSVREEIAPKYLSTTAEDGMRRLPGRFDVMITSPPYFGMNDYVRSQYLTWLVDPWDGYAEDLGQELGSRRDRLRRVKARRYIEAIGEVLGHARTMLKADAPLVLVLGQSQSAVAQEENPLGAIFEVVRELGYEVCWQKERRVRFRKINNTPFRCENIWVLRNS